MKTVKAIMLIICLLCATEGMAQTSFDTHFRVNVRDGITTLHSMLSPFRNQEQTLRNGDPIPGHFWVSRPLLLENPCGNLLANNRWMVHWAVTRNLTNEEIRRVGRLGLGVDVYVDAQATDWAHPVAVSFTFATYSLWSSIPPENFRRMEQDIIWSLWFLPNEKGRQLNFIRIAYGINIERWLQ